MEILSNEELIRENRETKDLLIKYEIKIRNLELIKEKVMLFLNECKCDINSEIRTDLIKLVESLSDSEINLSVNKILNDSKCDSKQSQTPKTSRKSKKLAQTRKEANDENPKMCLSPIGCDWIGCHYRTNTKQKLSLHQRIHKSLKSSVKRNRIQTPQRKRVWDPLKCRCDWPGCDKSFPTNHKLLTHMRVHTGEQPYVCDMCDKRFHIKGSLKLHRNLHLRVKSFRCEYKDCGQSFTRVEQLDKHVYEAHTGKMPHVCDWPGCGYQTCYRQRLQLHKRKHTGEKPFRCQWDGCQSSFTEAHHLKAHERKHTGERPFGCEWPGCDRKYKNRQAMKFHMKRVHNS